MTVFLKTRSIRVIKFFRGYGRLSTIALLQKGRHDNVTFGKRAITNRDDGGQHDPNPGRSSIIADKTRNKSRDILGCRIIAFLVICPS